MNTRQMVAYIRYRGISSLVGEAATELERLQNQGVEEFIEDKYYEGESIRIVGEYIDDATNNKTDLLPFALDHCVDEKCELLLISLGGFFPRAEIKRQAEEQNVKTVVFLGQETRFDIDDYAQAEKRKHPKIKAGKASGRSRKKNANEFTIAFAAYLNEDGILDRATSLSEVADYLNGNNGFQTPSGKGLWYPASVGEQTKRIRELKKRQKSSLKLPLWLMNNSKRRNSKKIRKNRDGTITVDDETLMKILSKVPLNPS